jgi:hypothetical protein
MTTGAALYFLHSHRQRFFEETLEVFHTTHITNPYSRCEKPLKVFEKTFAGFSHL